LLQQGSRQAVFGRDRLRVCGYHGGVALFGLGGVAGVEQRLGE